MLLFIAQASGVHEIKLPTGLDATYWGKLDQTGKREGVGIAFLSSRTVLGYCHNGKFAAGEAAAWYIGSGDFLQGTFDANGKWDGTLTKWFFTGAVDVTHREAGKATGEGVRWSADRKTAWRLENGDVKEKIKRKRAREIAKQVLDIDEPGDPFPKPLTIHSTDMDVFACLAAHCRRHPAVAAAAARATKLARLA